MNNRGFTLIEVLGVLIIVSIVMTIAIHGIQSTLSVGREESYKLMKNNIVSVSYDYIQECREGLIECDFSFEENNRFSARQLQDSGYFTDLNSPIDGRDLGSCLVIEAKNDNGVVIVDLIDECY